MAAGKWFNMSRKGASAMEEEEGVEEEEEEEEEEEADVARGDPFESV